MRGKRNHAIFKKKHKKEAGYIHKTKGGEREKMSFKWCVEKSKTELILKSARSKKKAAKRSPRQLKRRLGLRQNGGTRRKKARNPLIAKELRAAKTPLADHQQQENTGDTCRLSYRGRQGLTSSTRYARETKRPDKTSFPGKTKVERENESQSPQHHLQPPSSALRTQKKSS